MSGKSSLGDDLVKQVGVHLTVYLVHVSKLVILAISQRFFIARNSVQSDTIEVRYHRSLHTVVGLLHLVPVWYQCTSQLTRLSVL